MPPPRARLRAFTLIELLVVIAIISVLISILMPSLSRGREQAKTAKCLSNLREITRVMSMYFADNKNWFPWEKRNFPNNDNNLLHGFYYGGHPGRPGWWGYDYPNFRDTPRGRAFNPYLYDNLPDTLDSLADQNTAEWEQRRNMPVFECPSDIGGNYNSETMDDPSLESTYRYVGSSYDPNYHFFWNWASISAGRPWFRRPLQWANTFLDKQREFHASRFIMFFEDPFDSAYMNRIQRRGWHRLWNRYSFGFLDGHAANVYANTVRDNSGIGWKSVPRFWYNDPADPDYEYRTLQPRY